MKSHKFLLTSLVFLALMVACKENSTEPEKTTNTLTISHFGVDWSEGKVASETTFLVNTDGETIAWCPNGQGGGWAEGIWYRSVNNKIYKIGSGNDITSITSIDTTLWDNDVCDSPLNIDDIWVTETLDGFVVFKVINVATDSATIANDPMWSAEVEYKFSTTPNFN